MDVSIIIVNWNTKELLRQCVQSIYDETSVSFEIFVVDNASPDGSAEMIKKYFPEVHLIANKENLGFAKANNLALRQAKGKNILLLNPDTKILKNAIDKLVNYLKDSPKDVGAASCMLLNNDGTLQKSVGNFYSFWSTLLENRIFPALLSTNKFLSKKLVAFWDHSTQREIDWARGAVLMVRHEVMQKIGLLDEQFYVYGEELDWCWRIKEAGWRIMYFPDAQIIHFGKASTNQRNVEMFIQNYKSRYIFIKKHYAVYSYWFYRIRTIFCICLWLIRYYIPFIVFSKKSAQFQNAKIGLNTYSKFLKWNFTKLSWIKLMVQ